jgi:leader peptidase (prepilin peptidase)/N-methyltransferase
MFYEIFVCFIVGISFGSFMNVMNYRIPLGKSVLYPSSACPICNHKIKFYENIPLFSWLFLKGECSKCNSKISSEYFFVELFIGLFTVLYFYITDFNFNINNIFGYLMFYCLISLSIIDLKLKLVPISLLILSFVFSILYTGLYLQATLTGLVVLGFFYMFKLIYEYIRGIEVLGEGDLPILAIFGVLLGISNYLIYSILLACFIGILFSIFIYIKNKELSIPFVPSLTISLFISNFIYLEKIKNYLILIF